MNIYIYVKSIYTPIMGQEKHMNILLYKVFGYEIYLKFTFSQISPPTTYYDD